MMNKKLDQSFFADQVGRLSCLEGFPFHAEGIAELVRALQNACPEDRFIAAKIISGFTDAGGKCPDPRDISMAAYRLHHPEGSDPPIGDPSCEACWGVGFTSLARVIRGEEYHFSKPCTCRKTTAVGVG